MKIPANRRGLFEPQTKEYEFQNMHGIASTSEMVSSVLLPELAIQFATKKEGISYNTAVSRIFGTEEGHSLYFNLLFPDEKTNENKAKGEKRSRRKATTPRKIVKLNKDITQ